MNRIKIESVIKDNVLLTADEEEIFEHIKEDIDSVQNIFASKRLTAQNNLDFYLGNQWTSEEIEIHRSQMRHPFVFNEIKPAINHLIGSQQSTRMDTKAMPREKGDELQANILTFANKWVEQINQLEYTETAVFRSAIIAGVGAAMVYWSNEDLMYGYPKIEYIPASQLFWDLNAVKADLSDARWMARAMYITKAEALERYPDLHEFIRNNNFESSNSIINNSSYTSMQSKYKHSTNTYYNNSDRDSIEYIEHFEPIATKHYLVIDDISGDTMKFENSKDAKEYYETLMLGYSAENISPFYDDGSAKILYATATTNQMVQTIIIGGKVVEHELLAIDMFPYVVCFPYFFDGEWQSVIDDMLSPQIAVNRAYAQWDYSLGASQKNPVTVQENLLRKGWTVENVRSEGSKTSPYIPVINHDAFRQHPSQQANPQLFNTIEFSIQRMIDYSGGKNVRGFTESAAESGKAVVARAEQGGVGKLPIFDSLRQWRLGIAERCVWYIKNVVTSRQLARIIGNNQDLPLTEINDQTLRTIKELRVDIVVDEASKSDTIQEKYFTQLAQYFQIAQVPPDIASAVLLDYTSLPLSKKEELKAQLTAWNQERQKQMQMQQEEKIKNSVVESLQKKELRQQMEAKTELDKAAEDISRQEKSVNTQLENLQLKKAELAKVNGATGF